MTCAVDECTKPVKCRGWCSKHYERWRKYGDVTVDRTRRCDTARYLNCRQCTKPLRRTERPFCDQGCHQLWRHENRNPQGRSEATKRNQARKRAVIQAIKLERGCADCGYDAHAVALDFDHRPGETKDLCIGPSVTRVSLARLLAEIEKCDVVCANCHRVRTHERLRGVLSTIGGT